MSNDYARYNTSQVAAMFDISLETVRIWCSEFERHLSPRANPGHRQKRAFNESDLEVFALVSGLKNDGMTYQDIHVALDNDERGIPPIERLEHQEGLLKVEGNRQLVLRVEELETQLQVTLEENERLAKELDTMRQENLRNEVRTEMLQEQLEKADQRVKELLEERSRLEREIGSIQSDLRHQQRKDDG